MLADLLNALSTRLQRKFQGIPKVSVTLYEKLASKVLERMYDIVVEEIAETKRVVVDVGCGTGKLMAKTVLQGKSEFMLGLGISKAMINIAKKKILGETEFTINAILYWAMHIIYRSEIEH